MAPILRKMSPSFVLIMTASSPLLDLLGLVCLAFVLGLRHGVDADHLAAIDAMARFNAATRPALARLTGLWFSIGHGAVVLVVAFGVASVAHAWNAPEWLEPFGAWASIVILLLLGVFNLLAVRRTPPGAVVTFEGWRSTLYGRVLHASGAWPILGVGALFAISFDTLSQAALMAVTGTAARGLLAVALLAGAFVIGMIVTDGLNGWFVASLMARSHRGAARASRVMALGVSGVSIGTAALGAAAQCSPAADRWIEAHQGGFAALIVGVVVASFVAGLRLSRTSSPGDAGEGLRGRSS
jgi:high-affinity nickel-transport protein